MSKAEEKYLLENRLDNIVLNATDFKQNPEKWVYVSDVLEMYLKQEREKWEKELEEKQREILKCDVNPIYFSDGHDYLSGLFGVVSSITGDSDLSEDKITNLSPTSHALV